MFCAQEEVPVRLPTVVGTANVLVDGLYVKLEATLAVWYDGLDVLPTNKRGYGPLLRVVVIPILSETDELIELFAQLEVP